MREKELKVILGDKFEQYLTMQKLNWVPAGDNAL
jgi:hypothetical protein